MALTKIDDRGLKTPIDLIDNEKIRLGTGNDLEIFHDGSHSKIKQVGTGNLNVYADTFKIVDNSNGDNMINANRDGNVELYYDNEKVLSTTAAGILVENTNGNGELTIRGSEGNGALLYLHADDGDDNADKWRLDGSSDGSFGIQNYTSGSWEKSIKCIGDGAVELYYDNTVRLATNSNGIEVNGHVWLGDGEHVKFGNDTNGDLQIYHDASSSHILNGTGDLLLKSTGWISHACDNGQYWYNAAYNSVYARLDSDGLKFNGDTAAVNALDDYEEGTWTPSYNALSTGSVTTVSARYVKVGRVCHVMAYITIASTSSNNFEMSMPFTSAGGNSYSPLSTTLGTSQAASAVRVQSGSTQAYVRAIQGGDTLATYSNLNGSFLIFAGTYETDS